MIFLNEIVSHRLEAVCRLTLVSTDTSNLQDMSNRSVE